ncbi:unnamed protein product [Tetraodon nigroviridis]|uniref:(spotted green pufferfish) hypothetical protein n=1 Tax=Tetraodon nigroviridis TaxID=99883 RepID=Q4RGJ9_TETNG|nr:unnamed protein product [Tetraodon nigroviridis]
MTLQLRTRARLLDLHCSVGLTDWDMDKELRLATTTDQMYPDDRLSDQYVVQRPSARASRRKDEFVWYDKMSDTFVKPNLWLLVNPSIACPIQYGETSSDLQTVSEPAGGTRTDPAETRNPSPTEPRPPRFQEGLPGSEYPDFKNLNPGCWPRRPVNYCILIALALRSSHSGSLKVQQIYHFTRENFPFLSDGSRRLEEHHQTQLVLQQQLPQNLQPDVPGREEEVLFLAPDAGRPATADGRDQHVTEGDLPAAGAEHVPPSPRHGGKLWNTAGINSTAWPFWTTRAKWTPPSFSRTFPSGLACTEKVWTGLRFLAGDWLWVNKATLRYSELPPCPQQGQQCGALAKKDTGSVEGTDCLLKLNFLCYSST